MPDFKAERALLLAMNGRESEMDHFPFFLARELGKSLGEIGEMPHSELVQWRAYYTAKHAMSNQHPTGGAN